MTTIPKPFDLRKKGLVHLSVGVLSLVLTFSFYSHLTGQSGENLEIMAQGLKSLALGVLVMTLASCIFIVYGIKNIYKGFQRSSNPNSLMYYITNAFSKRKYWEIMIISAVFYAIIFGFLSQIFIFRPDISFRQQGITIPSVNLVTCCNAPGYVPMLSIYITEHFLALIIPLNAILAVTVAGLVGFNVALAFSTLEFSRKASNAGRVSFLGSIGAAGGLFIGCPTCAGSLISGILGFGFVGSVSVLASFQTLFIAIALPVLILTPFFIAGTMRRNLRGCSNQVGLKE